MKSNASLLYSFCLVVGDFLALVAAFAGAYILRVSISHKPISETVHASTYLEIFLLLLPFWILIFAILGLYNSSIYEKRFTEAGRLLLGSFLGLLFVTSYAYASDSPVFPAKLVPIYGFILAFLFLIIFRNIARATRSLLFGYEFGLTNVLIVGNTKISQELVMSLINTKASGYRVLGVVSAKEHHHKYPSGVNLFNDFESAIAKLKAEDIHGIVQTELYASAERNSEVLEYAQANHISYRFVPGNNELFVGNIAVELFRSSIPVIAVHQTPLIGWGRIVKRIYDIFLGGIGLLIALPFMLLIAIIVKLADLRGPVFYKVTRLSRFGTPITIYKFRTIKQIYNGLTPEQAFTKMGQPELIRQYRDNGDQLSSDPRYGRVGRFLWNSSLDELPQLLNVVKGDISLVGPRALEAYELEKHNKKDLILSVKSGLTGLAQVSGRRGISFEERRKIDLYYVQNWSIWLDITIILKTFRVLLRRNKVA